MQVVLILSAESERIEADKRICQGLKLAAHCPAHFDGNGRRHLAIAVGT